MRLKLSVVAIFATMVSGPLRAATLSDAEAAFLDQLVTASVVLEQSTILSKPVISSGAINFALRQMGIDDGPSGTFFGLPVQSGKDPFDMVGLGRHRSVSAWLQEIAEQAAAGNSRRAG